MNTDKGLPFSQFINKHYQDIQGYPGDICHDAVTLYSATPMTCFYWRIGSSGGTHIGRTTDISLDFMKRHCVKVYKITKLSDPFDIAVTDICTL